MVEFQFSNWHGDECVISATATGDDGMFTIETVHHNKPFNPKKDHWFSVMAGGGCMPWHAHLSYPPRKGNTFEVHGIEYM